MSDGLFAALDIGLIFALALGGAIWQLVVLRRGIRRDRAEATSRTEERDPSV